MELNRADVVPDAIGRTSVDEHEDGGGDREGRRGHGQADPRATTSTPGSVSGILVFFALARPAPQSGSAGRAKERVDGLRVAERLVHGQVPRLFLAAEHRVDVANRGGEAVRLGGGRLDLPPAVG